jgi:hypothetical protein
MGDVEHASIQMPSFFPGTDVTSVSFLFEMVLNAPV